MRRGNECPLHIVKVVPPKSNRIAPWQYDRACYTKRNEIEWLFPEPIGFRRIFSRFKKLDVPILGFPNVARIIETRR